MARECTDYGADSALSRRYQRHALKSLASMGHNSPCQEKKISPRRLIGLFWCLTLASPLNPLSGTREHVRLLSSLLLILLYQLQSVRVRLGMTRKAPYTLARSRDFLPKYTRLL